MEIIPENIRLELLANKNVESVTSCHIVYTLEFKTFALSEFKQGISARMIWLDAGFNIMNFNREYFRKTVNRWQKQQKSSKEDFGKFEQRGRLANKDAFKTDQEELEYLRAENSFLKDLRALEEEFENSDSSK